MKINYGKQNITRSDIDAVVEVLESDYLTTGPKVSEFEDKFAKYVGSKYAVSVANGTAALHLSAMALGVRGNAKVITSPITFAASANCIRYLGGQVDFCDIDPETYTLSIELVRQKLENSPKGTYCGLIPVDFAGYPVRMDEFRALAEEHGLWIIEDACHAPGGSYLDSKNELQFCGNSVYADMSIFSFHPVKHIACGEGGMVTTNSQALADKVRQLRSHGMVYQGDPRLIENHGGWYMELQDLGYNYRMPDILCALGISQLERAVDGIRKRRAIAKKYDKAFDKVDIEVHTPTTGINHAYHLYIIQIENRKDVYDVLKSKGIYTQVHYIPLHLMPYYKQFGYDKGDFPNAESYYDKCLSLPMYPSLTPEEQNFVIDQVKGCLK